jgi:hypothetical protein
MAIVRVFYLLPGEHEDYEYYLFVFFKALERKR